MSSARTVKAFLTVLGAVCDGEWNVRKVEGYIQHSCQAAVKWEDQNVVFLFNDGGQSAALPVTNFFSVSGSGYNQVLHLLILSTATPEQTCVLGKQFFANQWVEFDISSKLRVGFSVATSAKDVWR